MKQYIDKAALAAEIETRYNECLKRAKIIDAEYWNGKADAYRDMLVVLNTLEVKEVDFEAELDFVKNAYYYFTPDERDSIIAKHFYELGMQQSKK